MRLRRFARILAVLAALVAVGQWVVFIPLLAMGLVNSDQTYAAFVVAAFVGWPLLGVAAVAGAVLIDSRPRAAASLLVVVGLGLLYPFGLGGLLGLGAAALTYVSRRESARPAAGALRQTFEISRAVGIGVIGVIAIVFLIPTLISLIIYVRGPSEGPTASAEATPALFSTADEAIEAYARTFELPFFGACPETAASGSCIQSVQAAANEAIYSLCGFQNNLCLEVRVRQKDGHWSVTQVEKTGDVP